MLYKRLSLSIAILAVSFFAFINNSFAEKAQANPEKVYTVKFNKTVKIPRWAAWILKDTTYSIEWEGSSGPYCSGAPNKCYGQVTVTITSESIMKDVNDNPIDPDMFNKDSLLILGDDYIRGVDSGAHLAYIRMADESQGLLSDVFDITQRTILPKDSSEEANPQDFARHLDYPALFPTQKAKYCPELDAFVAYFYLIKNN